MASIFVSIASYRDPELLPTVRDLLNNLSKKNTVKITIGWQHKEEDFWDNHGEFRLDPRIKWINIDYKESKGVCWVRKLIQNHYNGEDYYLQLDSHHRFVKNWDQILIKMFDDLKKKGYEKPLLSTYLPQYHPNLEPEGRTDEVWIQNIDKFLPKGTAFLVPQVLTEYKRFKEPIPARFISAHFIFTIGKFVEEVPYDEELYFQGEESSLAVRAFTFGYDLFCPHRPIIWHEYYRNGKPRHWDDNSWDDLDNKSFERYRKLMGMDPGCSSCQRKSLAPQYFGKIRSFEDYEKYIGVKFRTKQIHAETKRGDFAPIKTEFESGLTNYQKHTISLYKPSLPEKDYKFFVIAFLDENYNDIYRKDAEAEEVYRLYNQDPTDNFMHIDRDFESNLQPYAWRVWPYSSSKGWQEKTEKVINYE